MSDLEEIKKNINYIRDIINHAKVSRKSNSPTEITEDDVKFLKQLLGLIETSVKMRIAEKVVSRKFTKYIEEIDETIAICKNTVAKIEEGNEKGIIEYEDARVAKLKEYIKELEEIKVKLSARKYDDAVKILVEAENVEERQQLIDYCALSNAYGYNSYPEYFGSSMFLQDGKEYSGPKSHDPKNIKLNKPIIDKVFEFLQDKELVSELTDYFSSRIYYENYEKVIQEEEDKQTYLRIRIRSLYDILGKYHDLNVPSKFKEATKYKTSELETNREKHDADYRLYEKLNRSFVSRLIHSGKIKELDSELARRRRISNNLKNEIHNIKMSEASEMFPNAEDAFAEDSYSTSYVTREIEKAKKELKESEERVKELNEKLKASIDEKMGKYFNLSDKAKSLSDEEMETCKSIIYFMFQSSRRNCDLSRITSLLIMKVLADIENLDLSELPKLSDADVEKIEDEYQRKYEKVMLKSNELVTIAKASIEAEIAEKEVEKAKKL